MKPNQKDEEEVMLVYTTWLNSYLNGDIKTYDSFLDDDYRFIGSTNNEEFLNRKDTTKFFEATADQLAGKTEIRNNIRTVEQIERLIFITDLLDAWFLNGSEWAYYGRFRFTSALQKNRDSWRFIYQHFSTPDSRAQEGETIGYEKIAAENLQLKDAIRRRTIELEHRNRELEIEAALERTRTHSMLMQHSNELDITSRVFHEQLLLLGIDSEFSYVWLPDVEKEKHLFWATWNEEQNGSNVLQSKSATYDLDRTEPYTAECFNAWESGEPVHIYPVAPAEVKNYFDIWSEIMGDAKKLKPEFFSEGLYYDEAFMKYGCFGIVIRRLLTEDEKKILLRFTIEFERTYTRFLDLQKAEAQAREAKIEASLEKVRSRSLAMHKSDELQEVVNSVFGRLKELEIKMDTSSIIIPTENERELEYWFTNSEGYLTGFRLSYFDNLIAGDIFSEKESGRDLFTKSYSFTEKNEFWKHLFEHTDFKRLPEDRKKFIFDAECFTISIAFSKNTAIQVNRYYNKLFSERENEIVKRFARVFEQAYTRFLDLQKAEAQARESQIEAALERVRSRTMAMQRSDELQDTALLLVQQVKALGVPSFACGFNIWDDDRKAATAWMAGEDRLQPAFKTSSSEDVFFHIHEAAQRGETLFIAEQGGEELETHYRYMASIPVFRDVMEKMAQTGLSVPTFQIIHCAFFSQGYLMFISFDPVPEAHDIFKRFAKVFEQTYTRFLDLQKAEAQAREAQINLAVERVRAKALAMYRSEEILEVVFKLKEEVMGLDIPGVAASTIFLKEANGSYRMWDLSSIELTKEKLHLPLDVSFRLEETDPGLYIRRVFSNTEHYFLVTQDEDDLQRTFQWLRDHGKTKEADEADQFVKTTQLKKLYHPSVQLNNGRMCIDLLETPSAEIESILTKMGAAFDLAYKRFEDLKNSEEQLREAQIEAGVRESTIQSHGNAEK